MWIIKCHEILSTFWYGTVRNNSHCSSYIMQCKIMETLQCETAARELRNLTHGHDKHADCTMVVHTHWHIWYFNFTVNRILCFVDRKSLYNLLQMKPTRCTLLLSIFISTSLHVSGNYVPIIRSITLHGWLSGLQTRQPPMQSEM